MATQLAFKRDVRFFVHFTNVNLDQGPAPLEKRGQDKGIDLVPQQSVISHARKYSKRLQERSGEWKG